MGGSGLSSQDTDRAAFHVSWEVHVHPRRPFPALATRHMSLWLDGQSHTCVCMGGTSPLLLWLCFSPNSLDS